MCELYISILAVAVSIIALIISCLQFSRNQRLQNKAIQISLLEKKLKVLNFFENGDTYLMAIDRLAGKEPEMVTLTHILFGDKLYEECNNIQSESDQKKFIQHLKDNIINSTK